MVRIRGSGLTATGRARLACTAARKRAMDISLPALQLNTRAGSHLGGGVDLGLDLGVDWVVDLDVDLQ